jgi:tetratricopeptide (TPR) repeat protein
LTGKTVSHYRVLERLGGGGMGVVYKAEDTKLGRFVALKFLPENLASNRHALERFRREARTASALDHPNICAIYEIGKESGKLFIAMQYLEGQTLRSRIGGRPLPVSVILELGAEIVDALEAAHAKGVIHRDMKPDNVFVTRRGDAKILDFGLAKLVGPATAAAGGAEAKTLDSMEGPLTSSGAAVGTVAYMSPEQVRGEELDARTDLFSLGLVLYEMATGRQAFTGNTTGVIHHATLGHDPVPVGRINPQIPEQLETVINKALEKDRELRYQSATEMRVDLERLKRDRDSRGSPVRARQRGVAGRATGRRRYIGAAAAVALVLAAAGTYHFWPRAPRLTVKDSIVIADFTNTTGDPVLDSTLRLALAAQLDQSPFLNIVSDQQILQALRLMNQPSGARLTQDLARQVCERTSGAAVLDGSIAQIGSQYSLVLQALDCSTGASLASVQAIANGKNNVLSAVGSVASAMRKRLGESLATVQKFDAPVEKVTTPSLVALQAYSLGTKALLAENIDVAISSYQHAISLDPNFAMAYARLGTVSSSIGEDVLGSEYLKKAYALRDRVSEREKFYISSHYALMVTGDLQEAVRVNELWAQTYPRDTIPFAILGATYGKLGQYEKALAAARRGIELAPNAIDYGNLAGLYLSLNRMDEAASVIKEAKARGMDSPTLHVDAYELAFLRGDAAGMAREVAQGSSDLLAYFWPSIESATQTYSGHLAKANDLMARAMASARQEGRKQSAAGYEASAALRAALVGDETEARKQAEAALRASNGRGVESPATLALAIAGNIAQAQNLAGEVARRFPEDTVVQFQYLPAIRAAIALRRDSSENAIVVLQAATPYELGDSGGLYPVYVRGLAYLAAHRGVQAAAEFQKIIDHPGVVLNEVIAPLAHLGLARARSLAGDKPGARKAYQDFLALWQHADPNIPVLQQAKLEYARLQ